MDWVNLAFGIPRIYDSGTTIPQPPPGDRRPVNKLRQLVGLSGFATVGKDEICTVMGFQRAAFADALKEDLAPILAKLPPHKKSDVRPLLVEYGKTARKLDPDYLVKRIVIPEVGHVCVTDLRYANECKFILSLGGIVIRVHRPGVDAANSEEEKSIAEIDRTFRFPSVMNNGTPEQAADQVFAILNSRLAASA